MSTHTPVCELLGIEHPIVSAPMAAEIVAELVSRL
jgi:NAD(P)H-dependent flavin oxidoreductase YrpB (nitropropane dioxygenase family)